MRKIKILAHISLDGVITPGTAEDESEYARGGWMTPYRSAEGMTAVVEAQGDNYDLLLGRKTYDLWSGYWPKAPSSPIADGFNAATKFVATHRPTSLTWNPSQDLGDNLADGLRKLKSTGDRDLIVWGSTSVTAHLFELGLVDEVTLYVYPVLLGLGKRFFADSNASRELKCIASKTTSTGVIANTYKFVGPIKP